MRILIEIRPLRAVGRALRSFCGLWFCLHDRSIHRRGPAAAPAHDQVMGRECLDCHHWSPLPPEWRERSPLALRIALFERKKKARRHARPKARPSLVTSHTDSKEQRHAS